MDKVIIVSGDSNQCLENANGAATLKEAIKLDEIRHSTGQFGCQRTLISYIDRERYDPKISVFIFLSCI
jgi:hypothetical protein